MSAHSPGNIMFASARASHTQITATTNDVATYSVMTSQAGGACSSTSSETKRGASRVWDENILIGFSHFTYVAGHDTARCKSGMPMIGLLIETRFFGAMTLSPPES